MSYTLIVDEYSTKTPNVKRSVFTDRALDELFTSIFR